MRILNLSKKLSKLLIKYEGCLRDYDLRVSKEYLEIKVSYYQRYLNSTEKLEDVWIYSNNSNRNEESIYYSVKQELENRFPQITN